MKFLKLFFCLGILLTPFMSDSQQCGFDSYRSVYQNDSSALAYEQQQNRLLHHYLTTNPEASLQETTYTIPVVYHIIHNNGPENVPDATILQSLDELNNRLQNNAPYNSIDGVQMDIQFCLATLDPFGNPTSGITRDESTLTMLPVAFDLYDASLKNINRWCPDTYLNIWIVADIGGFVAGYAFYPTANNDDIYSGIVMEYGELNNSHVLAHEVGHYFNLYHTFEGDCQNFNCMLDGDQVCDTPPDQSLNGCGLNSCSTDMNDTTGMSPFTSDVAELPNYMDYTSCPNSFTNGQRARCQAALTQLRPNLLLSNGCGSNPGGTLPVASFTIDSTGCSGTYSFNSTSSDALYTAWDFDNDGKIDTVGTSVSHSYTTSGYYEIQILVSGFGGSDTLSEIIYVHANPSPQYPIESYSGLVVDPIQLNLHACKGDTVILNGAPGMTSYLWSNGDTTASTSIVVDTSVSVSLTATDQGGYNWVGCEPIEIHVNPELTLTSSVGDTVTCGESILLSLSPVPYYTFMSLINTWYKNGVPAATNQLFLPHGAFDLGNHEFYLVNTDINGCVQTSNTVSYFVNPPIAPTLVQQGNVISMINPCYGFNWYQDGQVMLDQPNNTLTVTELGCYYLYCYDCGLATYSDTLCVTSFDVGIEETQETSFKLYPNPFDDKITVQLEEQTANLTIRIYEITGKKVMEETYYNSMEIEIVTDQFSQGTYLLELVLDGILEPRQIIIAN